MNIIDNPKVQRWKKESILRLAEHFHEFNKTNGQHLRVANYTLSSDSIAAITAKWSKITQMGIHLGLNKGNENENVITFVPFFYVKTNDGGEYFEMKVGSKDINGNSVDETSNITSTTQSEIVPDSYMRMVTENWNTMDFHLLDDLFVVQSKNVPVRVQSYHIIGNIIKALIQKPGKSLVSINLYMGVDMNKFSKTSMTSFTPIFGFIFKDFPENNEFDLLSALHLSRNREIFVQYSSPCPSTCPPSINA